MLLCILIKLAQQEIHLAGSDKVDLNKLRTSASILDPDLLQGAPSQYEEGFKNPCWRDKDEQLTCLPVSHTCVAF
jgi:hypothetical protein